jgi:hypothetical protein
MIKAEELRIGNYVFCLETYSVQRITGLTSEMPFIDAITFDYPNYDEIESIPLTEEWLFKFGFKYEEAGVYGKSGWFLKIRNQDNPTYLHFNNHLQCSLFVKINPFVFIDINTLKYVHQLQNLYFALTGEELNYKPL